MKYFFSLILLSLTISTAFAQKIVNVYAWTDEIPDFVVRQFEKETCIKVNFSTYENNELMYAKIRASKNAGYDVIMPSSYFVDRMRKQQLLIPLDKTKIPNWKNLNPTFLNQQYDPNNAYSVPYIWGVTGIFVNTQYYSPNSIKQWSDFWDNRYVNQLMLLEDTREVFAMALLSLGYSINDRDPVHIKQAFLKLK